MPYVEAIFTIDPVNPGRDIYIAQLAEIGFESFVETGKGFKAYIPLKAFEEKKILEIRESFFTGYQVQYGINIIEDRNWNADWESSYEPVTIENMVYIRASFHTEKPDLKFNVLIDPKMSFGTAHHPTTRLMIRRMMKMNLVDKTVLDMGCGTGVLAVLAEMMGAASVLAIDNDPDSVQNAQENVIKNKCSNISVQLGGIDETVGRYDVVLANINKNTLISGINVLSSCLSNDGSILFSGFYENDLNEIRAQSEKQGLTYTGHETDEQWVVSWFSKI